MRQIKFRGKRADNGEWVYGDLLQIAGSCLIYLGGQTETGSDIPAWSNVAVALMNSDIAVVEPSSVGQFTGLYDNNEKEIYEGDIFTVNGKYPKLIEYRQDHAGFCMAYFVDLDKEYIYPWQKIYPDWWENCYLKKEVIGNRYDNPELLTPAATCKDE